jgi:hypothetical protein
MPPSYILASELTYALYESSHCRTNNKRRKALAYQKELEIFRQIRNEMLSYNFIHAALAVTGALIPCIARVWIFPRVYGRGRIGIFSNTVISSVAAFYAPLVLSTSASQRLLNVCSIRTSFITGNGGRNCTMIVSAEEIVKSSSSIETEAGKCANASRPVRTYHFRTAR